MRLLSTAEDCETEKKVDTQSGAAETAAAKAINSNITEEFEHFGKR